MTINNFLFVDFIPKTINLCPPQRKKYIPRYIDRVLLYSRQISNQAYIHPQVKKTSSVFVACNLVASLSLEDCSWRRILPFHGQVWLCCPFSPRAIVDWHISFSHSVKPLTRESNHVRFRLFYTIYSLKQKWWMKIANYHCQDASCYTSATRGQNRLVQWDLCNKKPWDVKIAL